jgi:hypothetical protein
LEEEEKKKRKKKKEEEKRKKKVKGEHFVTLLCFSLGLDRKAILLLLVPPSMKD